MTVITIERGTRVRPKAALSPDVKGTVMAVFLDLENHPCAAVKWDRGASSVSRLTWLGRV